MIQTLAENPVALIEQGAPRRIHDAAQLEQYTNALFHLTVKEKPTAAERETIELLTLLIEDYESKYRLPETDPITVLRYLVGVGGLLQQDLRSELGSVSNISMILSGQRALTLANANALATRFGVDIRVFLPNPTTATESHARSKRASPGKVKRPNPQKATGAKRTVDGKYGRARATG